MSVKAAAGTRGARSRHTAPRLISSPSFAAEGGAARARKSRRHRPILARCNRTCQLAAVAELERSGYLKAGLDFSGNSFWLWPLASPISRASSVTFAWRSR